MMSSLHGDLWLDNFLVLVDVVFHRVARGDSPSGFGFELTFRLKKQAGETSPPSWPAELLQSLARYVFQSGKQK